MKGKTLNQITNTPKAGLRKLSSLPNNENFNIELISDESGKKYTIDVTELSNSTSGIESIVAGDNITVDNTDPLNPIVSATGGGSPAGSDTQIQYNNAGAFGASSDFTRSDTIYNSVIRNVEEPKNPTFNGTGLDDLSFSGTFTGENTTTYTITIASTGMVDTFDWTDGPNSGTGLNCSPNTLLSNGISIQFTNNIGHTTGDSWTFTFGVSKSVIKQEIDQSDFYSLTEDGKLFGLRTNQNGTIIVGHFDSGSAIKLLIDATAKTAVLGNVSGGNRNKLTISDSTNEITLATSHTQQSAVTFTGSGLDTLLISGTFSGTYPTTYTVTVDGNNQDFIVVDTSSITGGTFAISDVITNGTGGTATILSVNAVTLPSSATLLRVNVSAGTFNPGDTIDNGSGVTATTLSPVIVKDTYTWTDGTTTENNVYLVNSNGLILLLDSGTGYIIGESWTWDYTSVNQNVLDFSNNDYKFQSVLGTDTFGYQIGDNLLGYGLKGSVNTWTSTGGDLGISGFADLGDGFGFNSLIQWASGSVSTLFFTEDNGKLEVNYLGSKSKLNLLPNEFDLTGTLSGLENGVSLRSGVVSLGNISGGNNTKITIDDVNQLITVSNVPTYADDAAAATGGLTSGMLYKTTTGGITALNIVP